MAVPVTIDVPHRLGRAAARERMKARIGDLAGHMPGGVAEIRSSWPGEDEMALEIVALGHSIPARLDVEETRVRVHVALPPMLAMVSGVIESAIRSGGEKLLEDKSR